MKKIYSDAGFQWRDTKKIPEGNQVMGRICVADGEGFSRVELVGVGKVPNLKQYINIFELIAVARAIEIAIEKGWTGNLQIFTDSKVAMYWASNGILNKKVETEAHRNAYDYVRTARKNYVGIVTFNHTPREHNPAGHILEDILTRGRGTHSEPEVPQKPEPINRGNITLDPYAEVEI